MKKMQKKYDINQCIFYKCSNKRKLEGYLTLQKYDLDKIKNIIQYNSFEIDKKDSIEKREITAPCLNLKLLQARILYLLQKVERPEWLISGEKGKCYITNGKAHLNSRYMLTIDIKQFYNNCKREPVFRFFKDYLKTSGDIAGVLTDIVTFKGGIPTGCPTSQMLAFYAYQKMFEEISLLSKQFSCIFTLYVDDMTFSSEVPFDFKKLKNQIDITLRKYGHKPKYKKIKYYSADEYKPITGTVVTPDNQLYTPNNLRKKIYANFNVLKLNEFNINDSEDMKMAYSTLIGQINSARSIQMDIFPEIFRITKQIPPIKSNGKKSYRKVKTIKVKRNHT